MALEQFLRLAVYHLTHTSATDGEASRSLRRVQEFLGESSCLPVSNVYFTILLGNVVISGCDSNIYFLYVTMVCGV